jgi:hypothetical protein
MKAGITGDLTNRNGKTMGKPWENGVTSPTNHGIFPDFGA